MTATTAKPIFGWSSGLLALVVLLSTLACSGERAADAEVAPDALDGRPKPEPPATQLPTIPRGRWRLVSHYELGRVVLWVSHILIRYDGAPQDGPGLLAVPWAQDERTAKRTRAQARALALELADKVERKQGTFPELARRFSDDRSSALLGGSLGGVRANQLSPLVLDALQAAGFGKAVVVPSTWGYHVVIAAPPPQDRLLSGQRVVIRYRGSVNEERMGRAARTREEALSLAKTVAASKSPFVELVRRYSEHLDRTRDGDMGVWSLRDPGYNGRELEVLSGLEVGQVSAPLDTRYGFQVIKRVPVTDRRLYAIRGALVSINPEPPTQDPAAAKARAHGQALALAKRLAQQPEAIDAAEPVFWEGGRTRVKWRHGQKLPELEAVVGQLQIGEVASTPVDMGGYFIIAQSLDPTSVPDESPTLFELPSPDAADLNRIFRSSPSAALAEEVARFRAAVQSGLPGMPSEQAVQIGAALQMLQEGLLKARNADERVEAKDRVLAELLRRLGRQGADEFQAFLDMWATRRVMGSRE